MERFRASPYTLRGVLVLALMVAAGSASAASFTATNNITIPDGIADATFGGGPTGQAGEDQEVEHGSVASQIWDLEGIFLDSGTLSMIGGWNFVDGIFDPVGSGFNDAWHDQVRPDYFDSGDIFIAITENPFGVQPASPFDFVLDVNWQAGTFNVYQIAVGDTTIPVQLGNHTPESDPFLYVPGVGNNPLNAAPLAFADYATPGDTINPAFAGAGHYAVAFQLNHPDLLPLINAAFGQDVWFHFTMECGNDVLRGYLPPDEGGDLVPEPATMGLLGLALAGLGLRRRLAKK